MDELELAMPERVEQKLGGSVAMLTPFRVSRDIRCVLREAVA